jgi:hypothetical protein
MVLAVPYNNPLRRFFVNHLQSYVTRKRRRASWKLGFAEYRFSAREVEDFLRQCGFAAESWHPNDLRPPKNMGLWVDYNNLIMNPFRPIGRGPTLRAPGRRQTYRRPPDALRPVAGLREVICVARAV